MISITLGQGVSKITIPAIIHISNLIYEAQKESGISFGKAIIKQSINIAIAYILCLFTIVHSLLGNNHNT